MKRVGQLFGAIVAPDNLRLAFLKASRGKRCRVDQRTYQAHLDEELLRLREGMCDGSYPLGNYSRFKIFDPKEHEICVATFGERVLHHALMNVCEPYFDKWLIERTFACRKGKGLLKALAVTQRAARRNEWYLKCDFRKYFDSIPHDKLKGLLARKFKDERVLFWFNRIIDTYETALGRGLPIGNLTSQYFANLYLDCLDRLLPGVDYVRFMDDFVLWADSKQALLAYREQIVRFVEVELGSQLKVTVVNRSSHGMDFLGMRVFPQIIRANRRSLSRYQKKLDTYEFAFAQGEISAQTLQARVTALTAFLSHGETLGWRQQFLGTRREVSGSNRVKRGGSWNNNADNCTLLNRNNNNPSNTNNNGFRLACLAVPQEMSAVPVEFLFPSVLEQIGRAHRVSRGFQTLDATV